MRQQCAAQATALFSSAARSRMRPFAKGSRRGRFLLRVCITQSQRLGLFWHRVIPKLSRQRVASQQTLQSHPNSSHRAESLDCFIRVDRTRRDVAAAPGEPRRHVHFVSTQRGERRFHCYRLLLRRNRFSSFVGAHFAPAMLSAVLDLGIHSFSSRSKSAVNAAKLADTTLLFG